MSSSMTSAFEPVDPSRKHVLMMEDDQSDDQGGKGSRKRQFRFSAAHKLILVKEVLGSGVLTATHGGRLEAWEQLAQRLLKSGINCSGKRCHSVYTEMMYNVELQRPQLNHRRGSNAEYKELDSLLAECKRVAATHKDGLLLAEKLRRGLVRDIFTRGGLPGSLETDVPGATLPTADDLDGLGLQSKSMDLAMVGASIPRVPDPSQHQPQQQQAILAHSSAPILPMPSTRASTSKRRTDDDDRESLAEERALRRDELQLRRAAFNEEMRQRREEAEARKAEMQRFSEMHREQMKLLQEIGDGLKIALQKIMEKLGHM